MHILKFLKLLSHIINFIIILCYHSIYNNFSGCKIEYYRKQVVCPLLALSWPFCCLSFRDLQIQITLWYLQTLFTKNKSCRHGCARIMCYILISIMKRKKMMHRHPILHESSTVTSKKPAHKEQHKALYVLVTLYLL